MKTSEPKKRPVENAAEPAQSGARAGNGLTQRQETFCLAFIETGNASEAYRRSYKAKKAKANTVHEEASRLLANPHVTARLAELRAGAADRAQVTLKGHLAMLAELRDGAKTDKAWAAAITAEVRIGAAARLVAPGTPIALGPLTGTFAEQGAAVLKKMADGTLSPEETSTVMAALVAQSRIVESSELERRIKALEERQHAKPGN